MIDDGTNAGLPELSSSGLSADDEGYLNYSIDSVFDAFGFNLSVKDFLWNGGGNGIENANFSDTYATVEIFGADSVRLCVYDEFLQNLGCIQLRNAADTTSSPILAQAAEPFMLLYPNPAKDVLKIAFNPNDFNRFSLTDISGKMLLQGKIIKDINEQSLILNDLPAGIYVITLLGKDKKHTKQFIRRP
jgi:hypothetical protein